MNTKRTKKIATATMAVVFFIGGFLSPTSAEAGNQDKRKCVTAGEWGNLVLGTPKAEVREHLDWKGNRYTTKEWWYPVCDKDPNMVRVFVYFNNQKLRNAEYWEFLPPSPGFND